MKPATKTRPTKPELQWDDLAIVALPEREALSLCGGIDVCVSLHVSISCNPCGNPCGSSCKGG